MAAAGKDDLVFIKTTSDVGGRIRVPIAFDSVEGQVIVNACREFEETLDNLDTAVGIVGRSGIIIAEGKIQFPGRPELTVITNTLINDWQVEFEARPGPTWVPVFVDGANLFALNSFGNNPIATTAFTQPQIRQAQAGAIIEIAPNLTVEEFLSLKDL